jgi:type VI protein secretion system component Hcp
VTLNANNEGEERQAKRRRLLWDLGKKQREVMKGWKNEVVEEKVNNNLVMTVEDKDKHLKNKKGKLTFAKRIDWSRCLLFFSCCSVGGFLMEI